MRAPMPIYERRMKGELPLTVMSILYLNAPGRTTSVRLGMSKHHSIWMRITLKSDVTRIPECVTAVFVYCLCSGSECCEFGQV